MKSLSIGLDDGREAYAPGEEVFGTASWELEGEPTSVELRLFWYTRGKGTQDVKVVKAQQVHPAGARGGHSFRFVLPGSPYSFSGKLISLAWAIELVIAPGNHSARAELVMGPDGQEIDLERVTLSSTSP